MTPDPDFGDVERPDELRFQENTWRFQRIAWGVMALILLLAVLGAFGEGLFSEAMVGSSGGPRLIYPRTCRLRNDIAVEVFAPINDRGESSLELTTTTADLLDVEQVEPDPARVVAGPGGLTYVVRAEPPGGLARVRLNLSPQRPGLFRGRVVLGDGTDLRFSTFVHP